MKVYIVTTFIFFMISNCYAEERRTVGTYKQHMNNEEHSASDLDHNLHHMLYLAGVGDGYAFLNKKRKSLGEKLLYCQPDMKTLNVKAYRSIFEKFIYSQENPVTNSLPVSGGMLLALQHEFPCL